MQTQVKAELKGLRESMSAMDARLGILQKQLENGAQSPDASEGMLTEEVLAKLQKLLGEQETLFAQHDEERAKLLEDTRNLQREKIAVTEELGKALQEHQGVILKLMAKDQTIFDLEAGLLKKDREAVELQALLEEARKCKPSQPTLGKVMQAPPVPLAKQDRLMSVLASQNPEPYHPPLLPNLLSGQSTAPLQMHLTWHMQEANGPWPGGPLPVSLPFVSDCITRQLPRLSCTTHMRRGSVVLEVCVTVPSIEAVEQEIVSALQQMMEERPTVLGAPDMPSTIISPIQAEAYPASTTLTPAKKRRVSECGVSSIAALSPRSQVADVLKREHLSDVKEKMESSLRPGLSGAELRCIFAKAWSETPLSPLLQWSEEAAWRLLLKDRVFKHITESSG